MQIAVSSSKYVSKQNLNIYQIYHKCVSNFHELLFLPFQTHRYTTTPLAEAQNPSCLPSLMLELCFLFGYCIVEVYIHKAKA